MQPTSKTYYDTKCAQCDSCKLHRFGTYPDGRAYEACGGFGCILHTDKPVVTDIECTRYTIEEQQTRNHTAQSMREIGKQLRKQQKS